MNFYFYNISATIIVHMMEWSAARAGQYNVALLTKTIDSCLAKIFNVQD